MDNDYQELGSFYINSEQRTRVLLLDDDEKEVHESMEVARHLADRHDLRFGFSEDYEVLQDFDKKYQYLTRNKQMYGEFEALILYNHMRHQLSMGNNMFHNDNAEDGIREFINRESLGPVEDFNADTVLTF